MNIDKENKLILRRFIDLAHMAYYKNIPVFTDFLNMNEMSILEYGKNELPHISYDSFGGYEDADRKMVCFYLEEAVETMTPSLYPISCVKISPLNEKFADHLSHRDYLGAILNLGIDRSVIGDIILLDHNGFIFCENSISDFLCQNLVKIKHTFVSASVVSYEDMKIEPKQTLVSGTIASERLDCLIAFAFQSSRSSLRALIPAGKVFVNSKLILSESYQPKCMDVISVRGYGKFVYLGMNKTTKKGRLSVSINKYIT